ncbi:hypothetical protein TRIUR3_06784 [Triticum urartu]|uniref:Uncharacterized protein n=2 Tax=Triticum TaxID=4564 RepID=A0A9R1P9V1_TRITD|nr:hypothetical protein TRIUR3_06784 [Triticum urartu]VAH38970.1 unnamed protein product [Triticum turgidum subsp. durum]
MELRGAGTAANGGGMAGFLGRKSRYVRMDDVLPPDPEVEKEDGVGGGVRVRGGARRHVFLCSVFASLNHVLLGYDLSKLSLCCRVSLQMSA